jgi:hypothetical protein
MTEYTVQGYSSDEEEDLLTDNKKGKTHINRTPLSWIKHSTFRNQVEAEKSLAKDWSKDYSNETEEGKKYYYRCTAARKVGQKCSARCYLLYHSESFEVSLFKTAADHDHNQLEKLHRKNGISPDVKQIINGFLNDGLTKPSQILLALQQRKVQVPTTMQLNNYIAQFKKKKNGPSSVSLGEIEKWCKENEQVPENENIPFVVDFIAQDNSFPDNTDEDESVYFAFFISTVRLLELASKATHIHADATYKLIWQGYPVLVVGTTDLNKSFHPFGLAVCKDEQTKDFEFLFSSLQKGVEKINSPPIQPNALVADASFAIINAFSNVFSNDHEIIMCWAHMKRNVETKSTMINDEELEKEIISDIELLQVCESKELFHNSVKLFLKKWATCEQTKPFLDYFRSEWLEKHPGWFEGMADFIPSTNNALESTNRTIKDTGTFRNRLTLSKFLTFATKIVQNWSFERDESNINVKIFASQPDISLQLWTSSYQWAKENKEVTGSDHEGKKIYFVPANGKKKVYETEIRKFKSNKYSSFNQFKNHFNQWKLESSNPSDWKSFNCTCPAFSKNFICKHVVGMGIRLKLCKPPSIAKNIPLGQKRKRGRPSKAKKALLIQ